MRTIASLSAVLLLGSCQYFGTGQDRAIAYGERYASERAETEDQVPRLGELLLCRRMTVGAAQRRYGGRPAAETLARFCDEVGKLP